MRDDARIAAIDVVRGAVMILMALDHARDFLCGPGQRPTDLATTTALLFLTRWVTHFCAPVFVFLAGTGAQRYGTRHPHLGRFLLTRGLVLVVLEVAVMSPLLPDLGAHLTVLGILWVIGWSMIALAGLSLLPRPAVLAVGAVIVVGHNLLDPVKLDGALWLLLHRQGVFMALPGHPVLVAYPLLPWIGVMALGYGAGAIFDRPAPRRTLLFGGLTATAAFLLLRALNVYGDPTPWSVQPRGALFTVLSFLNCQKYPPSLLFLLMTLGPALVALALVGLQARLAVLGRVPLFFFVVHFALLRAVSAALAAHRWGDAAFAPPPGHAGSPEYPLWAAYLGWIAVVLLLYPLCRWFAALKPRHRWLSYL